MTWRTAYLPLLVILILAVSLLWNLSNVPVMSKKCRESETARHVYMRKLHLNDSDVNNVIILNETINWPQIHIQPKRFHLNRNLTFLVVVHSDVYNFDRRHELRHIFTKKLRKMANFDMLFVTGRPMESEIQKVVKEEAGEFDDVLQSFHIDNYQSMPMKAHAWISYLYDKFQNSTKFVLKIDDDVSINAGLVNNFLVSRPSAESEKSVFCYPFKVAADKRENSKFYLSEDEFPFRNLGIFCAGLAYILSADVVPHLYRNIQRTRFVWLDDWYVTHALLVNVDFTIYDTSAFYLMSETNREACNRLRRILDGSLPTPWFVHLRPRKLFDSFRQLEFWTRSQLCVDGFKDPRFV